MKNVSKVFLVLAAIFRTLLGVVILGQIIIDLIYFDQFVGAPTGSYYFILTNYWSSLALLLFGTAFGLILFSSVIVCPITFSTLNKCKDIKKFKTLGAFNIVFGSKVAGILMLCMKEKHLE